MVQKSALFEEAAFDPADQILDRPFLLRRVRPAHFDAQAEIEHDTGEADSIP